MLAIDPRDALVLARERARTLGRDVAAERLGRRPVARRSVAASMRRLAAHVDPAPAAAR